MLYTDGTTAYSNIALQIASGIGRGNPDFSGGVFSPRVWNGTLFYDQTSVVPEPSAIALLAAGLFKCGAAARG